MTIFLTMLIIYIFGNQYLLFNEELFIILAFLSLCYIVKMNLGNLVESELEDRKTKIANGYLSFLKKKSQNSHLSYKNFEDRSEYLVYFSDIKAIFTEKVIKMLDLGVEIESLELTNSYQVQLMLQFLVFVSKKRSLI